MTSRDGELVIRDKGFTALGRERLLPVERFDLPYLHDRAKRNLGRLALMIGKYMAGDSCKPTSEQLVDWFKQPEVLSRNELGALHELIEQWGHLDLWDFYLNSGCSFYEIARAAHAANTTAALAVRPLNALVLGYQEDRVLDSYRDLLGCSGSYLV